jgi:hypothetical protein
MATPLLRRDDPDTAILLEIAVSLLRTADDKGCLRYGKDHQ